MDTFRDLETKGAECAENGDSMDRCTMIDLIDSSALFLCGFFFFRSLSSLTSFLLVILCV
jgi:hypothetical protein